MALGVADAFADSFALEFGNRRKDREDELGDAVTGDITTKIEEPQRDPLLLELYTIYGVASDGAAVSQRRKIGRLVVPRGDGPPRLPTKVRLPVDDV
jgi:hypothetical protein